MSVRIKGAMSRVRTWLPGTLAAALLPVAPIGAEPGTAAPDEKPAVAERYQAGFDRAWTQADQGLSPTMACAQVIGTAVGGKARHATDDRERDDAIQAADACYVRATVLFLSRRLDSIEAGEQNCTAPMSAMAVHRASLGGHIDELGESQADFDQRITAAIGDRLRAACPDAADVILGEY